MSTRNNNSGDHVIYFVHNLLHFLLNADLMHSSLLWLVSLPFSMMSIVLKLYARGQGSKADKNSTHLCYKQLIMYMYIYVDEKKIQNK